MVPVVLVVGFPCNLDDTSDLSVRHSYISHLRLSTFWNSHNTVLWELHRQSFWISGLGLDQEWGPHILYRSTTSTKICVWSCCSWVLCSRSRYTWISTEFYWVVWKTVYNFLLFIMNQINRVLLSSVQISYNFLFVYYESIKRELNKRQNVVYFYYDYKTKFMMNR